jgi:hypothetical protein
MISPSHISVDSRNGAREYTFRRHAIKSASVIPAEVQQEIWNSKQCKTSTYTAMLPYQII